VRKTWKKIPSQNGARFLKTNQKTIPLKKTGIVACDPVCHGVTFGVLVFGCGWQRVAFYDVVAIVVPVF